jgi:hypothetical protein
MAGFELERECSSSTRWFGRQSTVLFPRGDRYFIDVTTRGVTGMTTSSKATISPIQTTVSLRVGVPDGRVRPMPMLYSPTIRCVRLGDGIATENCSSR